VALHGNAISVTSLRKSLRIVGLHLSAFNQKRNNSRAGKVKVEIWTKNGVYSGFQSKPAAWTKVHTDYYHGQGAGKLVKLNGFKCPIDVDARKKQAFYIHSKSRLLLNKFSASRSEKISRSKDIKLTRGAGFLGKFKKVNRNYLWNGAIDYIYKPSQAVCSWKSRANQMRMKNMPNQRKRERLRKNRKGNEANKKKKRNTKKKQKNKKIGLKQKRMSKRTQKKVQTKRRQRNAKNKHN